jgi:lysozyme
MQIFKWLENLLRAITVRRVDENQGELEPNVYRRHDCIPDISSYQRTVDFDELCANTDFVIMRARCCGKDDPMFSKRASELVKRAMPFCVYDYARLSSHEDAKRQAEAFYNLASPFKPQVYYIDTEKPADGVSYSQEIEYIKTYAARLRELGAERVGQYSGDWRYSTYYYKIADVFDTLWIAHYGTNGGLLENITLKSLKKAAHVDLRQYTSKGTIPGVPTKGDISILTGNRELEWFTGRTYE